MAFEPQINEFEIKYNKKLEAVKTQSAITLTSNGEKIDKVLFTRAMPYITNVTANAGSASLEGGVFATALVATESGVITSLTGTGTFLATYTSSGLSADSQLFASVRNLGTDSLAVSDNSVNFVSLIGVDVSMTEKQKVNYVSSLPKANQKVGVAQYTSLSSAKSESFELTTDIDSPNSISKVLLTESYGVLKEVTTSNDLVTLNGEIVTNLVYLTKDENPKLKNQLYSTEFHQEILCTGVTSEHIATASLDTYNNEFEVQGELSSSKGVILLKNKFNANIFVESNNTLDSVVDAFCSHKEMNLDFQSFVQQKILYNKNITDKVDGNVVLSEDDVRIDKVVATSSGLGVVNSTQIVDEEVVVPGTVYVNIVYLLDDEMRTTQAIQVEMPFESSVRLNGVKPDDQVFAKVVVRETDARNKKSKEIDVLTDIIICLSVVRNENEAVLSGVTLGEKVKSSETSMGMYVIEQAKDDWEVAKNLQVNPDILMQQNPNLTFPITKPTQIIVYRQQKIED